MGVESAVQLYGAVSAVDCKKKSLRVSWQRRLLTPRGDLICDNSLTYTVTESGRITF